MAYQHFYSCVPARISMYNKTDSFDTFAHSSMLGRDFILGELTAMYADKMRGQDVGKIRRGEISTVYAQAMLRPGVTVQTALTYLSRDYTGERSGYFAHSLVISEAERAMIFANRDALCFNPAMLITDIRPFNITSPAASPNSNYPELKYIPRKMNDPLQVISKYHPEIINYFLYAIIASLCGGGGDVVFRLPCEDKRASAEALELINAVMSILPYSLRELLYFVTYCANYDQYPGFKLKCVSRDCQRMPAEKGIFFDFEKNTISGFTENIEPHRPLIGFMYSLFGNQKIRDEFHLYLSRILATYPDRILTIPMLEELVFLFWSCSGFYTEESVLPTDEVLYRELTVYGQYKDAIVDEHKKQLYNALERYPKQHRAIPNDIFAILSELYPTETPAAKATCLNVLLQLIHTDIMRLRLFKFIKDNYDAELPEVKPVIVQNLAGVFYGGFLCAEIIEFFNRIFDSETEQAKDYILEKLLLSIRTVSVQNWVVSFLDRHYSAFTVGQKSRIYTTYLEMLPECDRLSSLLIVLVNKYISREPEKLKDVVTRQTKAYLDREYTEPSNRALLPLLLENPGFNEALATAFVLTERVGSEMYNHYIAILSTLPAYLRVARIVRAYKSLPHEHIPTLDKLVTDFKEAELTLGATSLFDFIRVEYTVSTLPNHSASLIREILIYPLIKDSFYDVFNPNFGNGGMARLNKYVEGNKALTDCEQYRAVLDYMQIVRLATDENINGAFRVVKRLPKSGELRRSMADFMRACSYNPKTLNIRASLIFELIINYLGKSNFCFDDLYFKYKDMSYKDWETTLGDKATPEKLEAKSAADTIALLLPCIGEICYVFEDYYLSVLNDNSGFARSVESFIESYGIGASGYMKRFIADAPEDMQLIINDLIKERNSRIDGVRGVVDLVNQSLRR